MMPSNTWIPPQLSDPTAINYDPYKHTAVPHEADVARAAYLLFAYFFPYTKGCSQAHPFLTDERKIPDIIIEKHTNDVTLLLPKRFKSILHAELKSQKGGSVEKAAK